MLHACVQKFDVTKNLEKFWKLNTTRVKERGNIVQAADDPAQHTGQRVNSARLK